MPLPPGWEVIDKTPAPNRTKPSSSKPLPPGWSADKPITRKDGSKQMADPVDRFFGGLGSRTLKPLIDLVTNTPSLLFSGGIDIDPETGQIVNRTPITDAIANAFKGAQAGSEGQFRAMLEALERAKTESPMAVDSGEPGFAGMFENTVGSLRPSELEAAGRGIAGALPIVGPTVAGSAEKLGSGDVAGGSGELIGDLISALLGQKAVNYVGGKMGFRGAPETPPELPPGPPRPAPSVPAAGTIGTHPKLGTVEVMGQVPGPHGRPVLTVQPGDTVGPPAAVGGRLLPDAYQDYSYGRQLIDPSEFTMTSAPPKPRLAPPKPPVEAKITRHPDAMGANAATIEAAPTPTDLETFLKASIEQAQRQKAAGMAPTGRAGNVPRGPVGTMPPSPGAGPRPITPEDIDRVLGPLKESATAPAPPAVPGGGAGLVGKPPNPEEIIGVLSSLLGAGGSLMTGGKGLAQQVLTQALMRLLGPKSKL